MYYADSFVLPGITTLEESETLIDEIKGLGTASINGRKVTWSVEADDAWDLAFVVIEVTEALSQVGIYYTPKKECIGG